MYEIVVAVFAMCIGAVFCFWGYKAMRVLFPLWGLIAGYWLGAELIHAITGDGFFSTTLAVVVGVCFALLGAILAYFYYAVSIIMFMGMVGFWLGAGFITLFGFNPGVISTLVGLALAVIFIIAAFVGNAPKVFLLFLTAFGGAALVVAGALVLINLASLKELQDGAFAVAFDNGWFWQLVVLGLGFFGYAAQLVSSHDEEVQWAQEWGQLSSPQTNTKGA